MMMKGVELQLGPAMVEEVLREWKREHPGCKVEEMPPGEFADRMMAKMMATARLTPSSTH
jgi:hypothetical protein